MVIRKRGGDTYDIYCPHWGRYDYKLIAGFFDDMSQYRIGKYQYHVDGQILQGFIDKHRMMHDYTRVERQAMDNFLDWVLRI